MGWYVCGLACKANRLGRWHCNAMLVAALTSDVAECCCIADGWGCVCMFWLCHNDRLGLPDEAFHSRN
jgi:hypothetical protein